MIRKLIYKMRKRRFCKLNRWFCPDCIYHDFVFDEDLVFRGNRCRYPKYRERSIEALKQVTGKLNNPEDSLLTADSEACKEQKSKLDLISRAEAIEHFMRLSEDESLTPYTQMLMVGVSNEIKKLPPADRPRGEWIDEDGTYYANCSKCGYQMDTHEERGYHNFCPNCGADMKGGDK